MSLVRQDVKLRQILDFTIRQLVDLCDGLSFESLLVGTRGPRLCRPTAANPLRVLLRVGFNLLQQPSQHPDTRKRISPLRAP